MLREESKPAVFEPPLHQRGLQRFCLCCLWYSLTVFICTTAQVFLMHISWATNKYTENTRHIIWFNALKPFSDNLSLFFREESSLQREKGHLPTFQKLHNSFTIPIYLPARVGHRQHATFSTNSRSIRQYLHFLADLLFLAKHWSDMAAFSSKELLKLAWNNTSSRVSFKYQIGFWYHQTLVHHAAMETQQTTHLRDHHRTSSCSTFLVGEHQDPYLTHFMVRILGRGMWCLETTQFCASEGQAKRGGGCRPLGELGKFLWPGKYNREISVLFLKSELQQLVIGFETKDEVRDQLLIVRNLFVMPTLCDYSSQHALRYFREPQVTKLHLPVYKLKLIWNLKFCRIILAIRY